MRTSITDLNNLLDDFEDYLTSGYRQPHLKRTSTQESADSTLEAPAAEPAGTGGRAAVHAETAAKGTAIGGSASAPDSAPAAGARRPAAAGGDGNGAPYAPAERESRAAELFALGEQVLACTRCALHAGRTRAVPGEGVLDPLVMVVGEGPGADEDSTGRPFVGRAGQYLDRWLQAIALSRTTNAYIANVVKCRPPGNRDPLPEESDACFPYLVRQIELVRPRAILAVGRIAVRRLLGEEAGVGRLRGRVFAFKGIPVVVTYHPSGVLRNPTLRAPVWEDLKLLKGLLEGKPAR